MYTIRGLACILAVYMTSQANAAIIADNGPVPEGSVPWACDSGPNVDCGGTGNWTIYDDFVISGSHTITGFDWIDWFSRGAPSDYIATNWSIFNADPFTAYSIFSGTVTAALSPTGVTNQFRFEIDSLSIALDSGVYWLGINNVVVNGAITTMAYVPQGSAIIPLSRISDGGAHQTVMRDRAFRVFGDSQSVPEPGTLAVLGFALAGFRMLRRRSGR